MIVKGYSTRHKNATNYSIAENDFFAWYDETSKEWILDFRHDVVQKVKVTDSNYKQGWHIVRERVKKIEQKRFDSLQKMMIFCSDLCCYIQKNGKVKQFYARIWTKNLKKIRSFLAKNDVITDELGTKYIVIDDYNCIFSELDYLARKDIKVEDGLKKVIEWHEKYDRVASEKLSYQQAGRDLLTKKVIYQDNGVYKDFTILNAIKKLKWTSGAQFELADACARSGWCSLNYPRRLIKGDIGYVDAKTMYWAVLVAYQYPCKLYKHVDDMSVAQFWDYIDKGYGMQFDCLLQNIKCTGVPCLPAKHLKDETIDGFKNIQESKNGYVVSAYELQTCLNEVDMMYIIENYDMDKLKIAFKNVWIYEMAYLPKRLLEKALESFVVKETFEEGNSEYEDAKAILNGGHGGMAMRKWRYDKIDREDVDWDAEIIRENERLDNFYGSLLWYDWSTAYARYRVVMLAHDLGDDWYYTDCDSELFGINDRTLKIIEKSNERWKTNLIKSLKARHIDIEDTHHLGEWCWKDDFVAAKFLKQKTYACERADGSMLIKMSGIAGSEIEDWLKQKGAEAGYKEHAALEIFDNGLKIDKSVTNKLVAHYSKDGEGYWMENVDFEIGNDVVNRLRKSKKIVNN